MLPNQPNNADIVESLYDKIKALEFELWKFKRVALQTAVYAMDEKGRVRIPVPDVRLTDKVVDLNFEQEQSEKTGKWGPLRIQIEFAEGTKIPASKKRTKPAGGKGKK